MSIPGTSTPSALPAGGGATLPVTAADELLDGASPSRFFTTADDGRGELITAASARALLGLVTTPDLSTTTGWTLRAGLGGATITGGKARTTLGTGVVPGGVWADQPALVYPHGLATRPPVFSVDAVARLATLTGGNSSNVYTSFGLRVGTSGKDGFVFTVRGDGGDTFGYAEVIGANASIGNTPGIGRSTIAGGQFWGRIVLTNGAVTMYYGTGSGGVEPTTWTQFATSTTMNNVTSASIANVLFALDAFGGGSPDSLTAEWDNCTVRVIGVGA